MPVLVFLAHLHAPTCSHDLLLSVIPCVVLLRKTLLYLDDVEEEPVVVAPTGNKLEQADEIGAQSAEEKALIAQMLSLGSRGGSLDKVVDKVDLEKILVQNGGSSNGNGAD